MAKNTPPKGPSEVKVLCPAKVNLFLRVLAKRPDNYHEIYSLIQPLSLYDELTVSAGGASAGISIETDSPLIPTDSRNLAYRAADLFLEKTGLGGVSVRIFIKKSIPVGAGLGGGSSDCAGVLMSLDKILGTDLGKESLMELGAALGSDVPFFILQSPAIATGRGEVVRPVKVRSFYYVLVNPGFSVSTEWVYGNLRLTNKDENTNVFNSNCFFEDAAALAEMLENDLEAVTCSRYPEILDLKAALVEAGASAALMSGSGPTVFGLFTDEEEARSAVTLLRERLAPKVRFIYLARGL